MALRRLLPAGILLCIVLAGVLAFAADLDLKSAKVTVFSNTLASPTLSLANAPSDTTQAGTPVTSQATLADDPEFPGGTASAGGTVTYRFFNDATCTTLHPTLHLPADVKTVTAGVIPASDAVEITKSGNYSWQATYSGDGNNQPFTAACKALTVTAADPAKLYFSQQPSASSEAGVAFAQQPKVEVRDTYDNVVESSTATIHLAISAATGDPAARLDCTPYSTPPTPSPNDQAAAAGVATFAGCKVDKATASFTPDYTLTASSASVTDAVSDSFVITPGTATKLVITGSTTQAAGATNDLTITARDNFDNVATSYTGTKSLTFSGANPSTDPATDPTIKDKDGSWVKFGVSTPITFANGIAASVSGTSNGVMTLFKAETVDIAATDGTISASGAGRLKVVVSAGAANKLAFSQQPSASTEAGEAFDDQPVVEVQDAYGNKVDTDTTLVQLALTEGEPTGVLDCDGASNEQTSVDGTATFSGCLIEKAGTGYKLGATSTTVPNGATSASFNITAGAATKFVVTGSATSIQAGETIDLTITAQDDFGNTDKAYDGDKQIVFSGANPSADPVTQPKVTPVTGGAIAFGTATTVHFVDGVSTTASGQNGVMTLYKAELAKIAATEGTIETAEEDDLEVTVSAAVLSRFSLSLTSPQLNGGIFSGATNTLTALDTYGNKVVSFEASDTNVTITANAPLSGNVTGLGSGGTNVLDQGGDFEDGVADLGALGMVYTGSLGTGTFTATAGAITGTSGSVTIDAGAATKFVITGSTSQTAGQPNLITITAKDASGNTATGYSGDKVLQFSGAASGVGPGAVPTVEDKLGDPIEFGQDTTITFTNGVATSEMVLYKAETANIVATQGSITTAGSDRLTVVVAAGSASALKFDVQPSDANLSSFMTPTVQVRVEDAYGNLVTTGSYSITLTISGSGAVMGNVAGSTSGIASFASLMVTTPGADYTLEATSPSLSADTSAPFDIVDPS
ncbi:MAG: beta strand repeat-containing protein [Dehalococcoidia bacterium]